VSPAANGRLLDPLSTAARIEFWFVTIANRLANCPCYLCGTPIILHSSSRSAGIDLLLVEALGCDYGGRSGE